MVQGGLDRGGSSRDGDKWSEVLDMGLPKTPQKIWDVREVLNWLQGFWLGETGMIESPLTEMGSSAGGASCWGT